MSHSNQKKIKTSKEYLINPQFYSQDDFYELKSEFFETYQKNDLKLLSDGLDDYRNTNSLKSLPEKNDQKILKLQKNETKNSISNFSKDKDFANKRFSSDFPHFDSFKNPNSNLDENFIAPANKYSYNSNPFPKVIPENTSNSYAEEYTQVSSNIYKNKPEELMSTYWGNSYEEPYKLYDSSQKLNISKFPEYDRKPFPFGNEKREEEMIFFDEKDRIRREEPLPLHCPNKFHFNPEGSYMFSTPQTFKSKPKEYPSENPYHSKFNFFNFGNKNHNPFSEYPPTKKMHSQQNFHRVSPNFEKEFREFSIIDIDASNSEENSMRCTKGLKYLTIKVKEIVCSKEKTSYKEVADTLLNILNLNGKSRFKSETDARRIIQNLKRRAYDALTVLVACGVFEKQGKDIKANENLSFQLHENRFPIKNLDETEINLRNHLKEKRKVLESKKNSLNELYLKYLSINNVIQRNTVALDSPFELKLTKNPNIFRNFQEEDQNTIDFEKEPILMKKNDSQKDKEDKKDVICSYYQNQFIKFPFIVIDIVDKAVAINMNKEKTKMSIHSKSSLKIYGDVDILLKMKMFLKFQRNQSLIKLIPRDIHQYLPIEIVEQIRYI